mgnify:FL=1
MIDPSTHNTNPLTTLKKILKPPAADCQALRAWFVWTLFGCLCLPCEAQETSPLFQALPETISTADPLTSAQRAPAIRRLPPAPASELVVPGWMNTVSQPILPNRPAQRLHLQQLIFDALQYSLQVKILAGDTQIERTAIMQADAQFDWRAFAESYWNDITNPTGSSLTTGGPLQFQNHQFTYEAGIRRQNLLGGQFEASQQFGTQNTNSQFFIPPQQGSTVLTLNYTQPLLRGAGRFYNERAVILAQVNTSAVTHEFLASLQQSLTEVQAAYWNLYFTRANLSAQRDLTRRAEQLVQQLELRENVDGTRDQLLRASAAAAARQAGLLRAEQAVVDAQSRLRELVNAPALFEFSSREFVPVDPPRSDAIPLDESALLQQALLRRPELRKALDDIKAGSIRQKVSRHELLPQLNLVIESYLDGIRGDYNIGGAFDDQFNAGRPSYTVGLEMEAPFLRREARATLRRTSLELEQLQNEFQLTVERVWIDLDRSIRELKTSHAEIEANRIVVERRAAELDYREKRWELLPPTGRTASLLLEDLLEAQNRLVDAQLNHLHSQINYVQAIINLKRATGTLLEQG